MGKMEDIQEEHDYLLEENITPKFCLLPPDPGPCTSKVNRWYFLSRIGDCIEFPWGGCYGNENNFISQNQCRASCSKLSVSTESSSSTVLSSSSSSPPALCSLPPDSGPCQQRLDR